MDILQQLHRFVFGEDTLLFLKSVVNDVIAVLANAEILPAFCQVEVGYMVFIKHIEGPVPSFRVLDRSFLSWTVVLDHD